MPGSRWIASTCGAMLMVLVTIVQADTLSIADNLNKGATVPQKGMTMNMVEARFGAPTTRRVPVGDPPITRWIYNGFRVYFEHQYVIHSVANR